MLEYAHDNVKKMLESRIIVTTTLANTLSSARSPVAIGADDKEIGELGANMLLRAHEARQSLTCELVQAPILRTRINRLAVERLGLRLDEDGERIR